jgi:hypothetical protein
MKPNTMHYVLTVDDSITLGRHFFPCASSQATSFGAIHTFIMNYAITNTLHDDLITMLRRIMVMWHLSYDEDPFFTGQGNPHVPDITTTSGFLDFMAIGNLLELAHVIDHRSYSGKGHDYEEQAEMGVARWRYRKLQVFFAKRYVTMVGEKSIFPMSIFRRSLVEFAAAVIVYKKSVKGAGYPKIEGCTRYQVERKMISLFEANYPELLPCLHERVKEENEYLYWTGPPITIRPFDKKLDRRRGFHGQVQPKNCRQMDFDDKPIFLENTMADNDPKPPPRRSARRARGE